MRNGRRAAEKKERNIFFRWESRAAAVVTLTMPPLSSRARRLGDGKIKANFSFTFPAGFQYSMLDSRVFFFAFLFFCVSHTIQFTHSLLLAFAKINHGIEEREMGKSTAFPLTNNRRKFRTEIGNLFSSSSSSPSARQQYNRASKHTTRDFQ